jgi:hypothetical protein
LAGVFTFRATAGLGFGFGFALCVTLCFAAAFGGAYAARAGAVDVTTGLGDRVGAAVTARWTSGDGVEATALGFVAAVTGAEATTGASGVGTAVAGFVGLDGFVCFD